VLSASTGRPASLDHVEEDLDVVTLVSRGNQSSPRGPVRLELRIMGSEDTTLVRQLDTPVPVIVAHSFRVPVSAGQIGLHDGRFHLQVRLLDPAGRELAASVPVELGVRVGRTGPARDP
jgi:hypothetical protein